MKTQIQSSLKAIFKLAMLALMVIAVSCSQETVQDSVNNSPENLNAQAAKGKKGKRVTKKISARIFNFPDPDQTAENVVFCLPGEDPPAFPLSRNIINGNMTHLGKLQAGSEYDEDLNEPIIGSYGVPVSCTPGAEDLSVAFTEFIVYYVAANGDRFVTEEKVTLRFNVSPEGVVDFNNGTFENTLDMYGDPIPITIVSESGTGRFEGATGDLFQKNGTFSFDEFGNGGSTWDLVGTITY